MSSSCPSASALSHSSILDHCKTMVAYLWLVWYESSCRMSPRHWALAVTYEAHDLAYATFYEVRAFTCIRVKPTDHPIQVFRDGNAAHYQPRVVRRVHLTSKHGNTPYAGKLLLGEINDQVLGALEMYSETATELVNSHTKKRGIHELACHDWAIIIVRSLEDALLLPRVSNDKPSRPYDSPYSPLNFRVPSRGWKRVPDSAD